MSRKGRGFESHPCQQSFLFSVLRFSGVAFLSTLQGGSGAGVGVSKQFIFGVLHHVVYTEYTSIQLQAKCSAENWGGR